MIPIITILIFLSASASAFFLKREKPVLYSSLFLAVAGGIAIFAMTLPVLFFGAESWHSSVWLVDKFSALMASLVAFIYIAATIVGAHYIKHEYDEKIITLRDLRIYFALFHLFVLCMVVSVLANNALLLWIALEGTTLASTFLVGLYRKKTSVEAAWKYIIICSTGISLGLIGILLLGYGSHEGGVRSLDIFMLSSLMEHASLIQGDVIRWAFVFLFVGFGAKVGLVPMHTWLPDAHSKAPSPISAVFSGILLNVALYAIIRFKFIADTALGDTAWTNQLFLMFGALSVLLPSLMMLVQKNYKRMLAYSSIEHMGLIVFALALSPIGAMAAVMHMIGHTLAKSMLFFGAGEILLVWKTTSIQKVKGLMNRAPYTGTLFLLGILAIVAFPPSALFISEYGMFVSAVAIYPKISLLLFFALGLVAYSMLKLTISMFFSESSEEIKHDTKKEKWNVAHTVMTLELVLLVVLAFWFTTPGGVVAIDAIVRDAVFIPVK